MYLREPCYDIDELKKENLHIHTFYSSCAKPSMDIETIVRQAEKAGLRRIAVTDHFNDPDFPVVEYNEEMRKKVKQLGAKVDVLFGAELSAYGIDKFLDRTEINKALDYRLYSCNHYHLDYWEHPEDKTPRGYAEHALKVVEALAKSGRADCVAHPFIGRFVKIFEDRNLITNSITDNEIGDILTILKENNVAYELNAGAVIGYPEFARRIWNIGKEVGVVFHMGMDAHRPESVDTADAAENFKKILL